MKYLSLLRLEFSKSIRENRLLNLILWASILISYGVILFINDESFSENQRVLMNRIEHHSTEIVFSAPVSYRDAVSVSEIPEKDDLAFVCFSRATGETVPGIVWTFFPCGEDPYQYLNSTDDQKPLGVSPCQGCAYVNSLVMQNREAQEMRTEGRFSLDDRSYTVSDIFLSGKQFEVFLDPRDFSGADAVDSVILVFHDTVPLRTMTEWSEKIGGLFADAKITLHIGLTSSEKEERNESAVISVVLLLACICNVCLIFSYLFERRSEDFSILRLLGIGRAQTALLLLLEYGLLNLSAGIIVLGGFCIYWRLQGVAGIMGHLNAALPVILGFLSGTLGIGLLRVFTLCRKLPAGAYSERS